MDEILILGNFPATKMDCRKMEGHIEEFALLTERIYGFDLLVPDESTIREVYTKNQTEDREMPFPFWARIWPAAKAMTAFIQQFPEWVKGKSVLEIGAGLALPSFAASGFAGDILATDHDPAAVSLVRKNISRLGIQNMRADLLDWNHLSAEIRQDTIICSDINYDPEDFQVLHAILEELLEMGKTILLSTPQRIMAGPFIGGLSHFIRHHESMEITHEPESVFVSVFILRKELSPA